MDHQLTRNTVLEWKPFCTVRQKTDVWASRKANSSYSSAFMPIKQEAGLKHGGGQNQEASWITILMAKKMSWHTTQCTCDKINCRWCASDYLQPPPTPSASLQMSVPCSYKGIYNCFCAVVQSPDPPCLGPTACSHGGGFVSWAVQHCPVTINNPQMNQTKKIFERSCHCVIQDSLK